MTLIGLKKSLHEKIDGSNDPDIPEKVAEIFNSQKKVFIIHENMK
jgi:hypothetical protein